MSDISEVYNKPTYLPFLNYCQRQNFKTMGDLARCQFHLLGRQPDISAMLASRVQAVYNSYCKSLQTASGEQPQQQQQPQPPLAAVPAQPEKAKAMTEPELVNFLRKYFQENKEKLIGLNDLVKAVGGRAKRTEISKILLQVVWCQTVDKATYFYSEIR